MIKIRRKSLLSGEYHEREIPISKAEYRKGMKLKRKGFLISSIFPTLSEEDKDFIVTGMTLSEWEELIY